MAYADGTIVIDTKINTDGVSVGTGKITAACKNAANRVAALGQNMQKAFAKASASSNKAAGTVQSIGTKLRSAFSSFPQTAQTVISKIRQIATGSCSASSNINKMGKSARQTSANLQNLAKSARSAAGGTGGLVSGLKSLLRYGLGISSLFMLFRKLKEAIAEGLSNLSGYSAQTNASIANLNAALSTLKNALATAFAPVLNVVAPILTKLINLLATAANYVAMFFSVLGGKSTYTKAVAVQAEYSAALEGTASGAKKAAKSTKEAAKAAKDYLSPLDEIKKVSTEKGASGSGGSGGSGGGGGGGGAGSGAPMFEEAQIAPGMFAFVERLKDILGKIFAPFKEAWAAEGAATIEAAKNALVGLQAIVTAVGKGLFDLWTSGTGTAALQVLLQLLQILLNLTGSLGVAVGNLLTSAFSLLGSVLRPVLQGISSFITLIQPIISWIEQTAVKIINWFSSAFSDLAQVFEEHGPEIEAIITGVGIVLKSVWQNIIEPVLNLMMKLWGELFKFWFDVSKSVLGGVIDFLAGVFTGDWDKAWSGIKSIFSGTWDAIENLASNVADILSGIWEKMRSVATEKMTSLTKKCLEKWFNFVKDVITKAVEIRSKVSDAFSQVSSKIVNAFSSVPSGIKKPINSIIGFINKMISGVVRGINSMISALNRLKFNIPEWVPGIGGQSFGLSIPTVSAPQIPYLASGAVIPPRSEFLAVLGDQKSGTNIETPERLLRQIMREELSGMRGGKGGIYRFIAQLNRRTIFDEMIEEAKLRQASSGENPFELA